MAADVRVRWRRGFLNELARSQDVGDVLAARGRRVLAAATAAAPVRTGDYQGSLALQVGVDGDRVKARVVSDDPAGAVIELKHHTLLRALEAARG
jgi:hypothetical protein